MQKSSWSAGARPFVMEPKNLGVSIGDLLRNTSMTNCAVTSRTKVEGALRHQRVLPSCVSIYPWGVMATRLIIIFCRRLHQLGLLVFSEEECCRADVRLEYGHAFYSAIHVCLWVNLGCIRHVTLVARKNRIQLEQTAIVTYHLIQHRHNCLLLTRAVGLGHW